MLYSTVHTFWEHKTNPYSILLIIDVLDITFRIFINYSYINSISIIHLYSNMDLLVQNRQNRQTKLVYPFLNSFFKWNDNLNINLENSLISTTHNKITNDIYLCIESHDTENIQTNLYIDVNDNREKKGKYANKYYHVTWAAISYFLRNVDTKVLLKPLKEINNNKSKFCDYVFTNKTYKNGIKRYKFFQTLNKLKSVEHPKDDNRFSISMYDDVVQLHKPYRFSIAFENNIVDGYITEKIINSFLAGCIPIYDGTDDIYKYFNRKSFINATDFDSIEKLAEYVIKVDNDPELYNKYVQEIPTTHAQLQQLFWWVPPTHL